jgi:FKBP-type peptidyl-prolyl cis-trans isomerase
MTRFFFYIILCVFLAACSSDGIKVEKAESSTHIKKSSEKSDGNIIDSTQLNSKIDTLTETPEQKELITEEGVLIKWKKKGKGEAIANGDVIKLNYVLMLKSGKLIEDTKAKVGKPIAMVKGLKMGLPGLDTALSYLKVGDMASVTLPADLGFDEETREMLKDSSELVYIIDVVSKISGEKLSNGVELFKVYPSTGPKVEKGHEIGIDYFGFLYDGSVFISSRETGEYEFPAGEGRVPPGLDSAILNMHINDVAWVKLSSEMAYGKKGLKGKVLPNQDIVYKIQIDYRK